MTDDNDCLGLTRHQQIQIAVYTWPVSSDWIGNALCHLCPAASLGQVAGAGASWTIFWRVPCPWAQNSLACFCHADHIHNITCFKVGPDYFQSKPLLLDSVNTNRQFWMSRYSDSTLLEVLGLVPISLYESWIDNLIFFSNTMMFVSKWLVLSPRCFLQVQAQGMYLSLGCRLLQLGICYRSVWSYW